MRAGVERDDVTEQFGGTERVADQQRQSSGSVGTLCRDRNSTRRSVSPRLREGGERTKRKSEEMSTSEPAYIRSTIYCTLAAICTSLSVLSNTSYPGGIVWAS